MEIRRQVKDGDQDEGGGGEEAGAKRRKRGEKRSMWGKMPICVLLSAAFTLNTSESGLLQFTGSTAPHTVEDFRELPK